MDDSCAVCADTLEWVAYGSCGHRDVCSTCVIRLRFICNDRRCCICKSESDVIFVTKALGDYTRTINDFSLLPSQPREGRAGPYWYHEDTQAYFDDLEQNRMIKAMCKLSCSVCDHMNEHHQPTNDNSKRRPKFRNIEQLKGHLYHRHKLFMCNLCLEGRKVFICEQKLYTRSQLNRHIKTGTSEADGDESERGGFSGHPFCEFCKSPFYGEHELYSHMSTDHYTCHLCQRQHPGQYEYYKNYDDLEVHFRQQHFLCEDEACLAKKFIVFQTEAEMKRHNTLEHGGRLSRSQRHAALQIPTSFRYRRSNDQDSRRGRRRTFQRDTSDNQPHSNAQSSFQLVDSDGRFHEDPLLSAPTTREAFSDEERTDVDPLVKPLELLSTTESEPSSRYLQAVSQNARTAPLEEALFPPLSTSDLGVSAKSEHDFEGLPQSTMAAHLRLQNNKNVAITNLAQAWPTTNHAPMPQASNSANYRPGAYDALRLSFTSGQPATVNGHASSVWVRPVTRNGTSAASSRSTGSTARVMHNSNVMVNGSFDSSTSDFPRVSSRQMQGFSKNHAAQYAEDVHTANKSLVEKIHAVLEFSEEKYKTFRDISREYRQGLLDSGSYLVSVQDFGLFHLVPELSRLCPDPQKQKELMETYNASLQSHGEEYGEGNGSQKGKEKSLDSGSSSLQSRASNSFMDTSRSLQSNNKPTEEDVEVLSEYGYHSAKGKTMIMVDAPCTELDSVKNDTQLAGHGSTQDSRNGSGGSKQRKKTSKFQRVRLGDGSIAALLDTRSDHEQELVDGTSDGNRNRSEGLPARGVWKNGGGRRLLSAASRAG